RFPERLSGRSRRMLLSSRWTAPRSRGSAASIGQSAHGVMRTGIVLQPSAPGMMVLVQVLQTLARHVGIDLRGREVAMAEQQLDQPQVGAVVQEVGCEGMPETVGRQLLSDPGF